MNHAPSTQKMKAVALAEWNWMGHHPTYFYKLLLGFRASGVRVLALCPAAAAAEITEKIAALENAETILAGVEFAPIRMVHERQRLPECLRGRDHGRRMFGQIAKQVRNWESRTGMAISLVFFNTIYDYQFENFRFAQGVFRCRWSGIYLHARAFRLPGTVVPYINRLPCPEKIFTLPTLSSVCVIDEGAVKPMENLSGGKPVFEFPDITDTALEPEDGQGSLAAKLRAFAHGRKIVVCLGHLQKTKGLLELCRAANDPVLRDVCFFFGGEVSWSDMERSEINTILRTWEKCPNVLTHLARLSDAVINALMLASDVVFAAYTNFPNSSNIMTKAAAFSRPIVVSDGFLMAERVEMYGTGKIVPEGDVSAITLAICDLLRWGAPNPLGYAAYFEKHSERTLSQVLARVIESSK